MKKLLFISIAVCFAVGCAKWISDDISNNYVKLISPLNNHSDSLQNKVFVWEELDGASSYQIQIVSPKFDSIVEYILDSPTTATMYSLNLSPGEYQWRVRGVNNDFKSKWSTRSLEISSTASLNGQSITSLTPITGTNSNEFTHKYTWDELISAENYLIQIYDENDTQIQVANTTSTNYSYTYPNEGTFKFSVQAINSISASEAQESVILVDTTRPDLPVLDAPSFDTIRNFPKNFEWTVATNSGSTITERLLIASDSLMSNILLDTSFVGNSPIALDSIPTTGKLYWRIDREDAAGNSNKNVKSKRFYID